VALDRTIYLITDKHNFFTIHEHGLMRLKSLHHHELFYHPAKQILWTYTLLINLLYIVAFI
jgi:hypothetical protein